MPHYAASGKKSLTVLFFDGIITVGFTQWALPR